MKYGSVCSGLEAASLAWEPLGWTPAFFSEIDKSACQVLKNRWPDVPLHGDFTTIKKGDYDDIDVLVGGTPCQDFSVAGLRKGLAGDRGGLTVEFVRLLDRLRPAWFVWENVPGVLSIDGGRAFGTFLGALAKLGYGFAYRILDAQHYGVAQRRRRVFVVGYFGDWRPPASVLFESESTSWNSTPRRETGERLADSLTVGANQCSGRPGDFTEDVTHTLKSEGADASEDGTGRGVPLVPETAGTLGTHKTGGWGVTNIDVTGAYIPSVVGALDTQCGAGKTNNQTAINGHLIIPTVSPALKARDYKGPSSDGDGDGAPLIPVPIMDATRRQGNSTNDPRYAIGIGEAGDPMYSLNTAGSHAIAFDCKASSTHRGTPGPISPCLKAMGGKNGNSNGGGASRRRIRPSECYARC